MAAKVKHFIPTDLKERFISGYDGYSNKADYIRCFIEKNETDDIKLNERSLTDILGRKDFSNAKKPESKTDYKALDAGRNWAYQKDLLDIAHSMGCEYITEAIAKMHSNGAYATDIAEKFERGRNWPLHIFKYMGLKSKPKGGRAHHGRNK